MLYGLNPTYSWAEGAGARPIDHLSFLPGTAFPEGTASTARFALMAVTACGLTMSLEGKSVGLLFSGMILVGAITSLIAIGQRLSPRPYPVFDFTGFFPYENHFAAFVNLLLPITLCQGMRCRMRALQKGKLSSPAPLFFCAAGLMVAAVSLCDSRAGLLIAGLIVGSWLLWMAWLSRRYPQLMRVPSRCVVPGAIAAGVFVLIPALVWAIRQMRRVGDELEFRFDVVADTLSMWLSRPWWGTGPGSFRAVFPYYQSLPVEKYFFRHAHCEPVQFLAELGVLGVLVCMVAGGLILSSGTGRKNRRRLTPSFLALEGFGLCVALVGVGLHSLVDFPFRHPMIALLTVVWAAILVETVEKKKI